MHLHASAYPASRSLPFPTAASSMSTYDKFKTPSSSTPGEDQYKRTLARLERIQAHLSTAPRGARMKDKVCIVTGVGSLKGIGRATVVRFAHEGARHVYCLDFDKTNLPDLKKTVEEAYPDVKVSILQADAADEAAIAGVCARALEEEGRLDVFFANAGIAHANVLETATVDEFTKMLRINTISCFLAVKHASAAMKKANAGAGKDMSGGSIVLTASAAGLRSGAGPTDYSASKAAVISIAQTAANQLARTDVRVNTLCPGLIETGMTVGTFDYARERRTAGRIGQLNPLGRYGVAEEVAAVALFLASDESSYVNGQSIAIDGGLSSSLPVAPGRFM